MDYWMEMAKRVEDMGADSLCIKDMAGLLVPQKATELITGSESLRPAFQSNCIHIILPVLLP